MSEDLFSDAVDFVVGAVLDEGDDKQGSGRWARTSRRRKLLLAVGAAVVIAAVIAAVVLITRQPAADYDDVSRARFIEACTADGGESVSATCECIYEGIVSTVPYSRFDEVDRQLRERDPSTGPVELPADIDSIRQDCVNKA